MSYYILKPKVVCVIGKGNLPIDIIKYETWFHKETFFVSHFKLRQEWWEYEDQQDLPKI